MRLLTDRHPRARDGEPPDPATGLTGGPAARADAPERTCGAEAALTLDLRGLKCPLPVLRTRRALRGLAPGSLLVVTCTDPMAAIDIPNLVREAGASLGAAERHGDTLTFRIRASAMRPHS